MGPRPASVSFLVEDLRSEWRHLDGRIAALDREFNRMAKEGAASRRLATIPGVGVINARALVAAVARIAYWNKRALHDVLFRSSAETVKTIAADPKRLGARVGFTSVLHSWGSSLTRILSNWRLFGGIQAP